MVYSSSGNGVETSGGMVWPEYSTGPQPRLTPTTAALPVRSRSRRVTDGWCMA